MEGACRLPRWQFLPLGWREVRGRLRHSWHIGPCSVFICVVNTDNLAPAGFLCKTPFSALSGARLFVPSSCASRFPSPACPGLFFFLLKIYLFI